MEFSRLKFWGAKLLILDGFQHDKTMPDTEKRGRSFYPPSVNADYDYSGGRIKWSRIAIVNESLEIASLVSRGPKNVQLALASRRAALSGNTSLIATSSIVI